MFQPPNQDVIEEPVPDLSARECPADPFNNVKTDLAVGAGLATASYLATHSAWSVCALGVPLACKFLYYQLRKQFYHEIYVYRASTVVQADTEPRLPAKVQVGTEVVPLSVEVVAEGTDVRSVAHRNAECKYSDVVLQAQEEITFCGHVIRTNDVVLSQEGVVYCLRKFDASSTEREMADAIDRLSCVQMPRWHHQITKDTARICKLYLEQNSMKAPTLADLPTIECITTGIALTMAFGLFLLVLSRSELPSERESPELSKHALRTAGAWAATLLVPPCRALTSVMSQI